MIGICQVNSASADGLRPYWHEREAHTACKSAVVMLAGASPVPKTSVCCAPVSILPKASMIDASHSAEIDQWLFDERGHEQQVTTEANTTAPLSTLISMDQSADSAWELGDGIRKYSRRLAHSQPLEPCIYPTVRGQFAFVYRFDIRICVPPGHEFRVGKECNMAHLRW